MPQKIVGKMKKSASSKSAFAHEEEDARADDFINRFRQQLKLQRLDLPAEEEEEAFINRFRQHLKLQQSDSLMRYQERLERERKQVDPNSVSSSNAYIEVESLVPVEGEVVDPSVSSSNSYLEVESQVPMEEEERVETSSSAELKEAIKFSYFATALAGGGILSLLIFHLENKSGEPHTLFFKALTFFVLATFASGLSIILLTICAPSASYQIPIIRGLVSATLIFLALTGVGVSIALMKAMGELAFVPAIVVVIVACIMVYYKKTVRSGQYLLQRRRIE